METSGAPAAVKRGGRKPPGRKTASKLVRFSGGAETAKLLADAREADPSGGITAGLASIAAAEGHRFIQAPTQAIAPHPYNASERSEPDPESAEWQELEGSVRANGVQVPILLVTRAAFVEARPNLAQAIDAGAKYITIYGHRRRAAAAAVGLESVPAVVDDSVLADGGDLDAMTIENLGRKDLTLLQQAEVFARYSEAGFGQRAIAERLGINQSTVSRKLRLLLLAPEILEAAKAGTIKWTEASMLGGQLPFGPPRPWQQDVDGQGPDADQDSAQRRADQIAAYELVLDGATPQRAAERVAAERRARQRAAADGIELIDAVERFGSDFRRHALESPAAADGEVVAAIDPVQGGLVYFPAEDLPPATGGDETLVPDVAPTKEEARLRAAAAKARRTAGPRLVASPPPRDKLLPLLAAQYCAGLTALASGKAGWALAHEYSQAAGLSSASQPDGAMYRAAAAGESDAKRQLEIAWACAVAAYELHAADKTRDSWGRLDAAYLQLLQERGGYSPTPWELDRLSRIGSL